MNNYTKASTERINNKSKSIFIVLAFLALSILSLNLQFNTTAGAAATCPKGTDTDSKNGKTICVGVVAGVTKWVYL